MWNSRAGCALGTQSYHGHFSGGRVVNVPRRQFLHLAGFVAASPSQFLEIAASASSCPQDAAAHEYALGDKILCAPYAGMTGKIIYKSMDGLAQGRGERIETLREFDPEGKGAIIEVT
jgi:hypothetical protein